MGKIVCEGKYSLSSRLELDLISSLDLVFGAITGSSRNVELDLISSLDLVFGAITSSSRNSSLSAIISAKMPRCTPPHAHGSRFALVAVVSQKKK